MADKEGQSEIKDKEYNYPKKEKKNGRKISPPTKKCDEKLQIKKVRVKWRTSVRKWKRNGSKISAKKQKMWYKWLPK